MTVLHLRAGETMEICRFEVGVCRNNKGKGGSLEMVKVYTVFIYVGGVELRATEE